MDPKVAELHAEQDQATAIVFEALLECMRGLTPNQRRYISSWEMGGMEVRAARAVMVELGERKGRR